MSRIEWSDELATGEPEVDAQHQQLIRLVNDFEDAAAHGKGRRQLDALLDELVHYTKFHFADEEALMERAGYGELEAHRRRHRQMVRHLERLRLEHEVHGHRITAAMRRFLGSWLQNHILKHDKAFVTRQQRLQAVPVPSAGSDPAPSG